ncbi:hypothetical protein QZH41_005820 [Actinostola sp. cb2023]|nr:hypothetical protein QZH41_005820 [Actinostola sp. cb2023]
MAASEEQQDDEVLLQNMYLKIAKSDVIVKSQQRGEPDFTVEQKVDILRDVLEKNPGSFLSRFGRFISLEDLEYFETMDTKSDDYELRFRIKEVRKLLDDKKQHINVQNRRYGALRRLSEDTDYFHENEMRKRNPLLYEQYIGQYLTDEERLTRDAAELASDPSLSDILMQRFDSRQTESLYQYQQEREDEVYEEEEDSDSDEEMGNDSLSSPMKGIPDDTEKQLLREEFLSVMEANFLAGKETEFDYTKVDTSDEYDDLKLRERDEEDVYFDNDQDE